MEIRPEGAGRGLVVAAQPVKSPGPAAAASAVVAKNCRRFIIVVLLGERMGMK
ncbi:MAG: hypothetical protein M9920_14190 [Verrucomicrobiae bacterium]|nr:hypothetical protein [Verrucomicrobiae bacterium]